SAATGAAEPGEGSACAARAAAAASRCRSGGLGGRIAAEATVAAAADQATLTSGTALTARSWSSSEAINRRDARLADLLTLGTRNEVSSVGRNRGFDRRGASDVFRGAAGAAFAAATEQAACGAPRTAGAADSGIYPGHRGSGAARAAGASAAEHSAAAANAPCTAGGAARRGGGGFSLGDRAFRSKRVALGKCACHLGRDG